MHRKLMSTWLRCLTLFLVTALAGAIAQAQTITGSIRGTVTDPSGAVVLGAKVVATNVDTGVASRTVTNHSGLYNFQFLPIGNYKVDVTGPGFDTQEIGPFALGIDQIASMDAKLAIGRSSESVSVDGSNSLLDTANSTISTSISSETLENMPLNGLNVQIATLFVPGAINPNASYMGGQLGTERDAVTPNASEAADGQPSFNGNRQQSNSYVLDGIDINETLQNALGYNPSPFSIQEVHVITGNADAEYGNVNGGEVVMVTKGGTNKFHGNIFEYHQASGLEANSYANKIQGPGSFISRAQFTQNQFGGAVGGPILKDKLFFFVNYLGLRHQQNGTSRLGVPTLAERGLAPGATPGIADLSGLLTIEGTQLTDNSIGGSSGAPAYVNNQIPIVNSVAKYLFATSVTHPNLLPLPNFPAMNNTYAAGNYVGPSDSEYSNDQGDIRLDYTLNNNNTFMLKVSRGEAGDEQTKMPDQVLFPTANNYPFTNVSFAYTHIFSPKLVNNFRAGYTRISLTQGIVGDPSGLFGINGDATVGIPVANQAIAGFTYMALGDSDISNFGTAYYTGGFNLDNNFDYNDTLTWVHGNHVTKFGVDFVRYQQAFYAPSNIGGQLGWFEYGAEFTNSGFGDFLADQADYGQIAGPTGPFGQRQWRDAVYVQDDWKVKPNLTFNLGLRYSYEQPIYEVNNKMVNVNIPLARFAPAGTPVANLLEYAGAFNPATGKTNSRSLYNAYYFNIMPRFGFAWSLTPRFVLSGGYGTTDELESTGTGLRMTQNSPYQPSFTLSPSVPGQTNGGTGAQVENGFTSASNSNVAGVSYRAWDPDIRPSVIQQFNLTTQYQINRRTTIQAGYVGQIGKHLAVPIAINQATRDVTSNCDATCIQNSVPFNTLVGQGELVETASRAISNYNGLQATLKQMTPWNGLSYMVNYTYSRSMTDSPGYFGVDGASAGDSYWQDANNPLGDYGPTDFDARHTLTGIAVYELPFGHNKAFGANWGHLADEIAGGWQVSMNAALNTGFPLTIVNQQACQNLCPQEQVGDYAQHANQYRKMIIRNRGVHGGQFQWFGTDPSANCAPSGVAQCSTRGVDNGVSAYGRSGNGGATGNFGNAHIGTERSPGYQNYDLALQKGFRTYDTQSLKLRVDAFNAFNISSYGNPGTYIGGGANPTFGVITGTRSGPRQLQLSAIYTF